MQVYIILIIVTCSLLVGVECVADKPKLEAKLNEKQSCSFVLRTIEITFIFRVLGFENFPGEHAPKST